MGFEILCPVRRRTTRTTTGAEPDRPVEMADFDGESSESPERVDDESAPIACILALLVGIRSRLDRTLATDRVGYSFVFAPGVSLASF